MPADVDVTGKQDLSPVPGWGQGLSRSPVHWHPRAASKPVPLGGEGAGERCPLCQERSENPSAVRGRCSPIAACSVLQTFECSSL